MRPNVEGSIAAAPVFIVGCGRSGTTMLRLMLDRHPDLAIPGESHFIPVFWRMRDRYTSFGVLDAEWLARDILSDDAVSWWKLQEPALRHRLDLLEAPGFADVVEAIYLTYAECQGKSRWGDKTPIYVRSIPLISQLFPAARFLHLIRDGRDVALSYMSIPHGPTNVWQAARRWRRDVTEGARAGRALRPDRYREVRYETLIAQPEEELKAICGYLDLPFNPVMLESDETALANIRPSWRFMHSREVLPPTVGLRDWRQEMSSSDVMAFEAVAGKLLTDMRYERRYSAIPLSYRLQGQIRLRAMEFYEKASKAKKAVQIRFGPVDQSMYPR